ncbi:acyltransferase [Paenibacillus sp. R14(2021)]|uniref:acyltransferase n=1 Tax=Paenibacillus sp. R14(2021) TaxID=2859228 RepID=UPI001C613F03|nr:acyltransferase [Paenibacillus sp. R14(2021)]
MRKNRIEEIEALRGLSFMAVVMQHAAAHYFPMPEARLGDGVMLGIILLAAKFAVPMFVFMTGLVLFYNYDGDIRYGTFVGKRCKDILLPYVPWAVLYAVEFQHLNLWDAASLSRLGMMIFTGKASYHLWYIVMIFQFYLLFPLLQRMVRKVSIHSARTAAAIVLALGVLYLVLMYKGSAIYHASFRIHAAFLRGCFTTYLDRNAIMYFFYFALGAFAGLHLEVWRNWLDKSRYIIWALYAAAIGAMLVKVVDHFKLVPAVRIRFDVLALLRLDMSVLLILSIAAVYIFTLRLVRQGPAYLTRPVSIIGAYSYAAYLAHAYVLRYTERLTDAMLPGGSVTSRSLLACALCVLLSVIAAWTVRTLAAAVRQFYSARKRESFERTNSA